MGERFGLMPDVHVQSMHCTTGELMQSARHRITAAYFKTTAGADVSGPAGLVGHELQVTHATRCTPTRNPKTDSKEYEVIAGQI
jgi:hypothetical protein